ncbi:P-loop containing nucleoside triphosphate hydrolase protein [Mycena albidolilacea]|uniref:Gluconokinase n=1 Tax=Mycena albidolilacea TaxID=1033008 RepID=A0AAD7ER10_9AGAR|nr:P-loop containing nucleoside triphosphate hydrolase protein [Mycena albidolilacea]
MAVQTLQTLIPPVLIIVMGVSGTGKSTLGAALAAALHMPYIDGDDLHPRANVDKMAAGCPLTDADREPWLRVIRKTAERVAREQAEARAQNGTVNGAVNGKATGTPGVVIACSALKRAYRDMLRGVGDASNTTAATGLPTYFVFIEGSREVLMDRMLKRSGHFMKATMLDSQLNTLENPAGEEGVVVVSVEDSTVAQVDKAVEALKV